MVTGQPFTFMPSLDPKSQPHPPLQWFPYGDKDHRASQLPTPSENQGLTPDPAAPVPLFENGGRFLFHTAKTRGRSVSPSQTFHILETAPGPVSPAPPRRATPLHREISWLPASLSPSCLSATAWYSSTAALSGLPLICSANGIRVVVPPQAADIEPDSKSSADITP